MRRIFIASLALTLCLANSTAAQNTTSSTTAQGSASQSKRRGPVFRANKEQIKQAQTILKQRGFYEGDATGKLDAATRSGLKKYQEAEGIKITGTLNGVTLQKMNITLTERQKEVIAEQERRTT